MPADRPTLDESWYRVAHLRPRLRSLVQVYRQHYRGRRWHVLRDPSTNQHYRLDDVQYGFVALLDGRRTVDDAWSIVTARHSDAAPTQGEAIRLLGQLYTANLLQADLPADAEGLFTRYRQRRQREVRGYLMNLLFIRLPLLDPDRFLDRWAPVVSWLFGPVGVTLWLALMAAGLLAIAGRSEQLFDQASAVLAPGNLPWLMLSVFLAKLLHELGHGFACKRFGRVSGSGCEVHTLGLMLMVFIPLPYIDASSAWALRSKWHRAFIGAAGMYAELAFAAIAAIVWSRTAQGTAIHAVSYNVLFSAGVTTILFNANPLIRFDGYYILSDLLETPNLAQRSQQYLYYLVKRYVYGVRRPENPSRTRGEKPLLLSYGIASWVYRVILCVGILLYVADKLFFVGAVMAATGLIAWVAMPLGKFARYLLTSPELTRCRSRAWTATGGVLVGSLILAALVPVPQRRRAEAVVEPRQQVTVHARTDGRLLDVLPSGEAASSANVVLARLENEQLRTMHREAIAQRAYLVASRQQSLVEETAAAQAATRQLDAVATRIRRLEEDLAQLQVKAPFAGTWYTQQLDGVDGAMLRRGQPLGVLMTDSNLRAYAGVDQFLGPRLQDQLAPGAGVELMVRGRPDLRLIGRVVRIMTYGTRTLRSEALAIQAGGSLAATPTDRGDTRAAEAFFEVEIELPAEEIERVRLRPGQILQARFTLDPEPLLTQGYRALRQVLQKRFQL